jgi:hypothetical protein
MQQPNFVSSFEFQVSAKPRAINLAQVRFWPELALPKLET